MNKFHPITILLIIIFAIIFLTGCCSTCEEREGFVWGHQDGVGAWHHSASAHPWVTHDLKQQAERYRIAKRYKEMDDFMRRRYNGIHPFPMTKNLSRYTWSDPHNREIYKWWIK